MRTLRLVAVIHLQAMANTFAVLAGAAYPKKKKKPKEDTPDPEQPPPGFLHGSEEHAG